MGKSHYKTVEDLGLLNRGEVAQEIDGVSSIGIKSWCSIGSEITGRSPVDQVGGGFHAVIKIADRDTLAVGEAHRVAIGVECGFYNVTEIATEGVGHEIAQSGVPILGVGIGEAVGLHPIGEVSALLNEHGVVEARFE